MWYFCLFCLDLIVWQCVMLQKDFTESYPAEPPANSHDSNGTHLPCMHSFARCVHFWKNMWICENVSKHFLVDKF